MLRYRRYRVFLIIAVFAIGALYHFTTLHGWSDSTAALPERVKSFLPEAGEQKPVKGEDSTKGPEVIKVEQTTSLAATTTSATGTTSSTPIKQSTTTTVASSESSTAGVKEASSSTARSDPLQPAIVTISSDSSSTSTAVTTSITLDNSVEAVNGEGTGGPFGLGGQGRHEVPPPLTGTPIYWSLMPEHFPVPSESLIALPTGKPKAIPKVQFAFKDESSDQKMKREEKRNEIKEAFKHSWSGYRKYAWLHDEVRPVSGGSRDPFCSWAATLVDALDTLVIMGLDEEFREATEALEQIDFTTSPRSDVPLFETTIRYLGGLLAAHDLSNGKYKVILKKATELADILMGAFDTPNRMPIMYYFWKPTFAANPHRAGTRAILAELGSLSVEFTHLAQITKENKYYDAVARITNELELFQSETKIPGLWPKYIDTSGCKKPERPPQMPDPLAPQVPVVSRPEFGETLASLPPSHVRRSRVDDWPERTGMGSAENTVGGPMLNKRQLDLDAGADALAPGAEGAGKSRIPAEKVDCQPQGLSSPPTNLIEHFTFGGAADSTYEYLPKQFMLLGGHVSQYRTMYEKAIDAANKHLVFRPMIPDDDREILVVGSADVRDGWTQDAERLSFLAEQSHLLCFTGGMWGIGSKIFGRQADMEIAEKLTDGCVWAYEATTTGIMPESMDMMACKSRTDCSWNETQWYSALDPWREQREESQRIMKEQELELEAQEAINRQAAAAAEANAPKAESLGGMPELGSGTGQIPSSKVESSLELGQKLEETADKQLGGIPEMREKPNEISKSEPLVKRQLGAEQPEKVEDAVKTGADVKIEAADKTEPAPSVANPHLGQVTSVTTEPPLPTETVNRYPTHEEYVEGRIKRERLPIGVPAVRSRDYILRPEAIESVFIMYRLTGDEKWREKGWRMWKSIQNATLVEHGHSAIFDVMRTESEHNHKDQMESFWLAETLKYFYLLFSPPNHISLDDYVLNTEAHPFKRPK